MRRATENVLLREYTVEDWQPGELVDGNRFGLSYLRLCPTYVGHVRWTT